MINRRLKDALRQKLLDNPAVVLMGPRQVGKTTLVFDMAQKEGALYLDLERPSDLAKITDIDNFC
jgi:predicted AAA+ superfamily ATPase